MNDMMQYWQQEWDAHRQDFNKWQEYLFQTTTHKPESISSIAEDTDRITGNGILIGTENLSSIYHPNEKRNVPGTVGGYLDMLYSTKAGKYVIKKLVENKEFVCYISENTTNNPNPHYDRQTHKISFFKRNKYGQIANSVIDNQKQSMIGISIILAHELFHAFQDYEQIDYHHSGACEVEAYLFSCIYYCQLRRNKNGVHWVFSLNSNNIPSATKLVFTPISTAENHKLYRACIMSLVEKYDDSDMSIVVNNFFRCSVQGQRYEELGYSMYGENTVYNVGKSLLRKYNNQIYQ